MKGGLFHPNCRHTISLWIEGHSKLPEPMDAEKIKERSRVEQKQRSLERKVRKCKRQVLGLSDEAAVRLAKQKLKQAQSKLKVHIDEHDFLRRDYEREKVYDTPHSSAAGQQLNTPETLPNVQIEGHTAEVDAPPPEHTYPEDSKTYVEERISPEMVDNSGESGIMKEKAETAENDVHIIGKIDLEIYKCVTEDIVTDEVVITETQIQHIKDHHPNDYENFCEYFGEIISRPDYIIEANKPNTAIILKEISADNKIFKTVLRLITSNDNPLFKNSIITFMKIDEKEWKRLIKNKKILYKAE